MVKNPGKQFEEDVKKSANEEFLYIYKLKDSGSYFGNSGKDTTRFTISNDYDYFIFYKCLFPLELKSSKENRFTIGNKFIIDDMLNKDKFSNIKKTWQNKQIKINQVVGLLKASNHNGIHAGFMFNFRKYEDTYWMNILDFMNFLSTSVKKSISKEDIIINNGILVKQELKRVHYRYNMTELLCRIMNKYKE